MRWKVENVLMDSTEKYDYKKEHFTSVLFWYKIALGNENKFERNF